MRIFLTGATGYIGSKVAEKLRESGHQVSGLARSAEAAAKLEKQGLAVVRGNLTDAASLARGASQADGVIQTAMEMSAAAGTVDRAAVSAMLEALGPGKPFVYTSGIWVVGDTAGQVVDEEAPLHPTPLVAWRPGVENLVLESAARGVVIRPGMVYGRGAGMPAQFQKSARETGAAQFIGTGENRWPFVHVDDLADLYVRLLEAPRGTLVFATSGPSLRVREVAEAASRAAGAEGRVHGTPVEEARQKLGLFADALTLDQQVSSARAERLLGWRPQAPGVLEELAAG